MRITQEKISFSWFTPEDITSTLYTRETHLADSLKEYKKAIHAYQALETLDTQRFTTCNHIVSRGICDALNTNTFVLYSHYFHFCLLQIYF